MPDWAKIADSALALARGEPDEVGWLRWIDDRLASDKVPPMPRWWSETLTDFYRSGKPEFAGLIGMRGTKSYQMCKVAVAESLLRPRKVAPGTPLVWGIYSVDMHEANGRAATLKAFLQCLGLRETARGESIDGGSFRHTGGANGRSSLDVLDAEGHEVSFRIAPASSGGASGYTGVGIVCDELDLWRDSNGSNPAAEVLSVLSARLIGQRGARMYRVSAPFAEHSPHTKDVRQGDTEAQFVARLGEHGGRRDEEARGALRRYFERRAANAETRSKREQLSGYASDKRLTEPADPLDYRIPTWVARDDNLDEIMVDCWRRAARDAGKEGFDPLEFLFARFGARPTGSTGEKMFDRVLLDAAMQRSA